MQLQDAGKPFELFLLLSESSLRLKWALPSEVRRDRKLENQTGIATRFSDNICASVA
jgi:hypothetical protein